MRAFTGWEKEIIQKIVSAGSDKMILMKELLEEFYFTEAAARALIIQAQAHYAVFFLQSHLYNDESKKKEELERFLELITLINYLRFHGYISLYRDEKTKERSMIFIQDDFLNPQVTGKTIILNAKGDYTVKPETIHDKKHNVIYQGVVFDSETYETILSATTGTLLVSNRLRDMIEHASNEYDEKLQAPGKITNKKTGEEKPVIRAPVYNARASLADEQEIPVDSNTKTAKDEAVPEMLIARQGNKNLTGPGIFLLICLIVFGVLIYVKSVKYDRRFVSLANDKTAILTELDKVSAKIQQLTGPSPSPNISHDSIHYGIDISKWNGNVVGEINQADSLTFVICRASMGRTKTDPDFYRNWKLIKGKNLIKGAYHFYYTFDDPIEQAEFFWSIIQSLDSTDMPDMPLIVDIEDKSLPGNKQVETTDLQVNLLLFLKHIELKSKRVPILYTGYDFGNKYLTSSSFSKYPLWLAEYRKKAAPQIPKAWKEYKIWQRSDSFRLSSRARVDYDIYYGDRSGLIK